MTLPVVGDRVTDRYVLDERVGAGGMGVVWRATDSLLHRQVALKQVGIPQADPDAAAVLRDRIVREARAAARVQNPHAVAVYDVLTAGDARWLVMEYVPGRSLERTLLDDGALPVPEAAGVGAAVAVALAAAHRAGVVHRDVKPANVLVGDTGTVKLADFGIALIAGDARLTMTGPVVGTVAYLAPEVADGADATAASDVYSLGATVYAAVEGRGPYADSESNSNPLRLLRDIAHGRFREPERAGPLEPVLAAMMQRDPAARPSSDEAARMLAAVAASPDAPRPRVPVTLYALPTVAPAVAPAAALGSQSPPIRRRRRSVAAVAASAVLVAGVLGATAAARPVGCDTSRGELAIGVMGTLAVEDGLGGDLVGGAQVALDQANAACAVPGYRLVLRVGDTTSGPTAASRVARSFVDDPALIGVIGPDQTGANSAWRSVAPVLAQASIAQLCVDTRAELTVGPDPEGIGPDRLFPTLFRVVGRDPMPARLAAYYLVDRVGARRIAVIADDGPSGAPFAASFAAALARGRVTPVAVERVTGIDSVAAAVSRVGAQQPDAVFVAVDATIAPTVADEMTSAGIRAPIVSSWPVLSEGYVERNARDGDLLVTAGADPALLPAAAGPVLARLTVAAGRAPTESSVLGFDSIGVLVAAMGRAVGGHDRHAGDRAAVVDAVQHTHIDGLTGPISFDPFGDVVEPSMNVHRIQGGALVPWAS